MNDTLLKVDDLWINFDGIQALAGFECSVQKGEILGLIGPNGAGKTTFFNVLSGFLKPSKGTIRFNNSDVTALPPHKISSIGISRTFQNLRLIRQMSILENVLLYFQQQPGESVLKLFVKQKQNQIQEKTNINRALTLLGSLGLEEKAYNTADALSYGQQKLLSIACCLASDAKLIILDEPVAGINPMLIRTILEIIKDLPTQGKTVILIEHNIDAVMEICDRIIFMDEGKNISEGTPHEVKNDPQVIEAYLS